MPKHVSQTYLSAFGSLSGLVLRLASSAFGAFPFFKHDLSARSLGRHLRATAFAWLVAVIEAKVVAIRVSSVVTSWALWTILATSDAAFRVLAIEALQLSPAFQFLVQGLSADDCREIS